MVKVIIILALFMVGCASRGGLTLGSPFEDTAKCPPDRHVIYKQITVNTAWDTQEQEVQYSWQCTKNGTLNDTYRIYKTLNTYKPEPEPRERFHGKDRL